ncbi:MAG: IS200/IS605 family transposase [Patescibacteria group bacterium]
MGVTRSHHCVYDTHYHIVFPVKYRKALLSQPIASAIQEIAQAIEDRYEITFEKMGTDGDHIHILCSYHPKYASSYIVGMFKSVTARQLFARFPELKKELWGGEFWTDGYYISTVGTRGDWATVERYVANQGKTMGKNLQLVLWK